MGAWDYGFYKYDEKTKTGTDGRNDTRLAAGIIAIKNELRYTGFARDTMVGDLPYYGSSVANSVKDFQTAKGLNPDGVVGPTTAKELFRKRVALTEIKYGMKPSDLVKQLWLESAYDPVAVGSADPGDSGIAQIHLDFFPSVSVAESYDPAFAIDWAGAYISGLKGEVEDRADTYKAARAAYNVGDYYATLWMKASFPDSGGPLLDGQDVFTRATKYLAAIDKQAP